jgi:alkanesulfonate monooxygenase SsuD/methylene tetrahydromethanopterin reductase-like flavin-dependent oxidoreductase (luciferase family)
MRPMNDLAFGITAGVRPGVRRIGAELERLGYAELWSNDTRRGDGIATLAAVAPGTSRLGFALGVVALSEHDPAGIERRLVRDDLPRDRLVLGIGSGGSSSIDLVRAGVGELRERLPDLPIAIAAVGPRMLRLAGEVADAVVATWAVPERVPWIRARVDEGRVLAGRPIAPRLVLYVRAAIGDRAAERLRAEMDRYAGYGRHYARAFVAQPDGPVGIAVADPSELPGALIPYREAADTVVVRALPVGDDVGAWLEVAEAAVG